MFFNHLINVKMTYIEHCIFSLKLSIYFFNGFIKAIVHAFIPDIFITSSSDLSELIIYKIESHRIA